MESDRQCGALDLTLIDTSMSEARASNFQVSEVLFLTVELNLEWMVLLVRT